MPMSGTAGSVTDAAATGVVRVEGPVLSPEHCSDGRVVLVLSVAMFTLVAASDLTGIGVEPTSVAEQDRLGSREI